MKAPTRRLTNMPFIASSISRECCGIGVQPSILHLAPQLCGAEQYVQDMGTAIENGICTYREYVQLAEEVGAFEVEEGELFIVSTMSDSHPAWGDDMCEKEGIIFLFTSTNPDGAATT